MTSLRTYDTPLRLRRSTGFARSPSASGSSVATQLYDRVLQGVNFASWLRNRTEASVRAEEDRRKLSRRFEGTLVHSLLPYLACVRKADGECTVALSYYGIALAWHTDTPCDAEKSER